MSIFRMCGCRTARHIYSIRTPQPVKSFLSQKETNPLLNSALGMKIQLNHQKCRRHQSRLLISRHYTDDVLGALSRVQQQVKVILSNVDKVFNPAGPSNEVKSLVTTSPDPLHKSSDLNNCCIMRRNVTNFMKRLRQILNHLCLLVNSALNTKCKDVSFLVEMCQFVVASLLKPVSCSCLKCTLSPSSCLNCFT